jgi:hypothetical protein
MATGKRKRSKVEHKRFLRGNHELSITIFGLLGLVIRSTSNAVKFCPCAVVEPALRPGRHGRRVSK